MIFRTSRLVGYVSVEGKYVSRLCVFVWFTLPETNVAPENRPSQRKLVFQPSIFSCYVSFREGTSLATYCFDVLYPTYHGSTGGSFQIFPEPMGGGFFRFAQHLARKNTPAFFAGKVIIKTMAPQTEIIFPDLSERFASEYQVPQWFGCRSLLSKLIKDRGKFMKIHGLKLNRRIFSLHKNSISQKLHGLPTEVR